MPVSPPARVKAAGVLTGQVEDQLLRYRSNLIQAGGTDARTRRALQTYEALQNSGRHEMLSEMLGLDEYA